MYWVFYTRPVRQYRLCLTRISTLGYSGFVCVGKGGEIRITINILGEINHKPSGNDGILFFFFFFHYVSFTEVTFRSLRCPLIAWPFYRLLRAIFEIFRRFRGAFWNRRRSLFMFYWRIKSFFFARQFHTRSVVSRTRVGRVHIQTGNSRSCEFRSARTFVPYNSLKKI